MIQRLHQPRHPANAAFKEGETQVREPIQRTAHDKPRRAHHISQREAERAGEHFETIITFAADQPGVTILGFEDAGPG